MTTEIRFPDGIIEEGREDLYSEDVSNNKIDDVVTRALLILDVWNPSARGKAPTGVAATAVYVSAMSYEMTQTHITQHQLCDVFNTSPVTIRNQKSECLSTAREEGVIE